MWRRLGAGILGLAGAFLAFVAVTAPWGIGETYGNVTDGGFPSLLAVIGLVAAMVCGAAVALWRPGNGRAAGVAFVAVVVAVTVSFGVALLVF